VRRNKKRRCALPCQQYTLSRAAAQRGPYATARRERRQQHQTNRREFCVNCQRDERRDRVVRCANRANVEREIAVHARLRGIEEQTIEEVASGAQDQTRVAVLNENMSAVFIRQCYARAGKPAIQRGSYKTVYSSARSCVIQEKPRVPVPRYAHVANVAGEQRRLSEPR